MPVMFKPAKSLKVDLWRNNSNVMSLNPDGSLYHIEIEVEVDEDAKPIRIQDLADLRRKFGQEACCWKQEGKVFVMNRDLEWDRADGDVPIVLGVLFEEEGASA